jgi:hypothetical protein
MEYKKISELKFLKFTKLVWTDSRKKLKQEITDNGFDNQNYNLKVSKDLYVLDGNHRLSTLVDNFEPDYEVKVEIINLKMKYLIVLILITGVVFSPIVLLSYLIHQYKIFKNKIPNEFI